MSTPSDISRPTIPPESQPSNLDASQDLVQRYLHGDPQAAREIVETHLPTVYKIAMKLSGRREDAEDLTQDIFVKVFANLSTLRNGERLAGWIYTIARNHVCWEIGQRQRRREYIIFQNTPGEPLVSAAEQESPEDSYLAKEERQELTEALANLGPIHLEILTLRDIVGMSYAEIATQFGVPIGTVRSRLSRARQVLMDMLAKRKPSSCSGGHR